MTNEEQGMNGDPHCCARGRGDRPVSAVNLAADVPDRSGFGLGALTGSGRSEVEALRGRCGGFKEGVW